MRPRQVDLRQGHQQAPEFLTLNPLGKVPLLADDKPFVLTQSNAIIAFATARGTTDTWRAHTCHRRWSTPNVLWGALLHGR